MLTLVTIISIIFRNRVVRGTRVSSIMFYTAVIVGLKVTSALNVVAASSCRVRSLSANGTIGRSNVKLTVRIMI